MLSFKDKVVWVTGNVSGVGKATTKKFAQLGAKVIVHEFNNEAQADELYEELKVEATDVLRVEGDITKRVEVEAIVEKIKNYYGTIDILVNNVGGLTELGTIEQLTEEQWDHVMDVNLKSMYLVTKAALPLMKENGGRIVNISSCVEKYGGTLDTFAYTAAKGGVSALTRALAKYLIKYNIAVNGIAPGLLDTPFHDIRNNRNSFDHILSHIPMNRAGNPEEIADKVLFLASEMSNFMIGELLEVSGGRKLS